MSKVENNLITVNRKARYNYHIEQIFEAGLCLQGWEVKSLRAGRAQLSESYVVLQKGEAFLLNANISPLATVSKHIIPVADRTRKLLLNKKELDRLIGLSERKGMALIPLDLHWKYNYAKLNFALGKGKKDYDKRASEKERQWKKEKLLLKSLKHGR